jgi:phosphodiesterase/alkaline phosphatase D-like protein
MPEGMSAMRAAPELGAAPSLSVNDRRALSGASVRWRALVAGALLSLALGAAVYEGLADQGSSVAGGARPRASSRQQGLFSLPGAAQAPVSQALGADSPAYGVRPSKGGFSAASPAQRLQLRFDRSGVSLGSGATQLGLSLREMGYGGSLVAVGQVAPHRLKPNRVLYQHAGLSEWYANGPLGLEQGFTIARAPSGRSTGALTLSLALSGNARASVRSSGQSITLRGAGGPELRYSGLSATDALGRVLRTWLALDAGRLLLRVDARGARYPVRIDPFVQQGEKLTGNGERGEEGTFGYSAALSSDGNTALIGGPGDNGKVGAAWVFTREGSSWKQQGAKLTGRGEGGKGEFGYSVALTFEGNTALIGGPGDIGPGENNRRTGAAWVFTRSGSTWTQQGAKLTAKSGEEIGPSEFGYSVALGSKEKEEASTALIGGPGDGKEVEVKEGKEREIIIEPRVGAAWAFTRSGSTWTQQGAKLTPTEGITGREFGRSVALSSKEGNTALIGAPGHNAMVGAAWAFIREGTTWKEQAKLTAKETEEIGAGSFGYSLVLSSDGNTALIGAPGDNNGVGAAWVFTRSGTIWTQQGAKLTAKSGEEIGPGEFGRSVALASNGGNTALIGASGDNADVGATWVFTRSGSTWTQQGAKLTAKSGEEIGAGQFGGSVALSSEGATALIGAASDGFGIHASLGAAWVFTRSESGTWTQQGPKLTGSGEIGEGESSGKGEFGYTVSLASDGNTALIGGPADNNNVGAAWVFTRSGSTWTQQAKLTAKSGEAIGEARFGKSVALASTGGNYALIGAPGDNGGVGAAWVFTRSGSIWTQQGAKLTAKSGEEIGTGEFGWSVAVSSEATYALIGGAGDSAKVGAAWVFKREAGEKWTQQGTKLTAKSPEEIGSGEFGYSVALSSEYALIGGPGDNGFDGAAWVFKREAGEKWTQQGEKFKLATKEQEEVGLGEFGKSLALSSEGNYALIGGPGSSKNIGAAWVWIRESSTWKQQAKLTAKSGEEIGEGHFGKSVALSSNKEGNYALIGSPTDAGSVGAAYVFTRSGSTWTQQGAKLTASSAETGEGGFGSSVALSSEEGATALIGSPSDNGLVGAAWAFTRSVSTWTQQGEKITGGAEIGAGESGGKGEFGYSVAVSANGNTALIGGRGTLGVGAAWVFTRSGSTWTQQGEKLLGGGESGAGEFGYSVALSSDGNTALIGGPSDNAKVGAAWVFTREGSIWTKQGAKLTGSGEIGAVELGSSVALSSDGNTALIGGPGDNGKVGAAWVFTRSGSTWTQQGAKLHLFFEGSGEIGAGEVGSSVALSPDGNTALLGGPGNNGKVGAAWVFTRSGSTWTLQGATLTGSGEIGSGQFGSSVALSSKEGNTALIGALADNGKVGAAWVFTRSGSTWTQQGSKLTGSGEIGTGEFGSSVALSSEPGNTALIGGPGDNSRVGAAWVFTRSGSTWTQQGEKLTSKSPEEIGEGNFGSSVALSSEGSTALIGGAGDNGRVGAAWVFLNPPPTVVTGAASSVTLTSATLNATVNPNGSEVSECKLEYGTSTSYGSSAPCTPAPGSGTIPVAVSASVTGLGGNTTYHFRVSATSSAGTSTGSDQMFKTLLGPPAVETKPASEVKQTSATLNATVNPMGAEVTECKLEYGTNTSYGSSAPCTPAPGSGTSPVAVSASVSGLTANTTYHFRVSAKNAGGISEGSDQTFKTLPNAPTVVTEPASSVGSNSATLNATVNPNGGEVSECKLEYGTTIAYGSSAPCTPSPGSGTSPVAVSASVTGLVAKTTYHFRVSATNASGKSEGSDRTFNTGVPTVVTGAASAVTKTAATLNATVNPNGLEVTECKLEYGTSTAYGSSAPCTPAPGSGTSPVAVSASVSGLTANTTYHFRVSAKNAGGISEGSDQTFKTLPNAPTVVTGAASSVTQTSATMNATVNPNGGGVSKCRFEWGEEPGVLIFAASCASLPGSGETAVPVSASLTGLIPTRPYYYRISATNAGGTSQGAERTFTALPNPPTVVTEAASSVTATSATLNATVNPNNGEVSECKFEYGTTTAYGSSAPCTPTPGPVEHPVAVAAAITGLTPNTTYHFRISATTAGGTSTGSDQTFKTLTPPPTVVTEAASAVAQTSATLHATVNPNGLEVSECKFEYGTTTSYGSSAPCTPSPGSGTSPVAVSAAVTGLVANTTYHFRIVAKNLAGTSNGSDQTFKTLSSSPTAVSEAASSVAQTSATLHGTVNPNGFEVSACRFEYGTSTAYGSSAPCTPPPGSGTSFVPVSAALESLGENTAYHFRIVATGPGGTSLGGDQMFTTLLVLGPHWYQNGVIVQEGALGTDVLEWGALTLENSKENSKVGAVTCQTLDGGDVANPAGGGAGKGAVDAFTVYDCVAPTCEAAGGKLEVLPEKLEWSTLLIEEAGVFRNKLEGIGLRVICAASALNVEFHGTLKPRFKAGTAIGSSPSKLEFEAASGSLESAEGPGTVTGNLKLMGFEGGEVIRAKNP